jgi:hypothetical protein
MNFSPELIMEYSHQIRNNILTAKTATIAQLECFLLVHEKVQQRTEKERSDYEKLLKSRTLFPKELISKLTSIKQLLSPGQVLKEDVIDWMVNYTVEPSSALSMVQLAKTVSTYICKTIDIPNPQIQSFCQYQIKLSTTKEALLCFKIPYHFPLTLYFTSPQCPVMTIVYINVYLTV